MKTRKGKKTQKYTKIKKVKKRKCGQFGHSCIYTLGTSVYPRKMQRKGCRDKWMRKSRPRSTKLIT